MEEEVGQPWEGAERQAGWLSPRQCRERSARAWSTRKHYWPWTNEC